MSRHSRPLQELHERIQDGEIGDIILMRGYRMHGPRRLLRVAAQTSQNHGTGLPDPAVPQLPLGQRRQLQRLLHPHHRPSLLDEERLAGQGPGAGRSPLPSSRRDSVRRPELRHLLAWNTPSPTASKFYFDGRCMKGAAGIYSSYVHGSKGMAIASQADDFGRPSASTRARTSRPGQADLAVATNQHDPYQNEWDELIDAIRNNKPYNEVKRGVEGEPRHAAWAAWRRTRARRSRSRPCSTASTASPRPGEAVAGRYLAAAGRAGRQVSRAYAGAKDDGVLRMSG